MTDARLPEWYLMDRRVTRLNAEEWQSFTWSLLWSVSNRTNGRVEEGDLGIIPRFLPVHITRFVELGLWSDEEGGWTFVDWERTQTSKSELEVLDRARAADAAKKRRQRAHKAGNHELCDAETCSFVPNVSPGRVPGTAQERLGQDRRGRDEGNPTSEPVGWATSPPGSGLRSA